MAVEASHSMGRLEFARHFIVHGRNGWCRLFFLPSALFHMQLVPQLLLLLLLLPAAASCIACMQGAVICVRQVAVTRQGCSAMKVSAYRSSRAGWFTCACVVRLTRVMLFREAWLIVSVQDVLGPV
jgi:hypothetical protein